MSGDPANTNDDELLNQIDELKARMDQLMRGWLVYVQFCATYREGEGQGG